MRGQWIFTLLLSSLLLAGVLGVLGSMFPNSNRNDPVETTQQQEDDEWPVENIATLAREVIVPTAQAEIHNSHVLQVRPPAKDENLKSDHDEYAEISPKISDDNQHSNGRRLVAKNNAESETEDAEKLPSEL